ncbi:sel1 repeat family protein, partial [Acidovorax sp. HMWF018]
VLQERGLAPNLPAPVGAAIGAAGIAAAAGLSAGEWGRGDGAPPSPGTARPPEPQTPRSQAPSPSRSRTGPTHRSEEGDEGDAHEDARYGRSTSTFAWHLGHAALGIGVANGALLMAFFKPGASFRVGMVVLGLIAALGAWRTARDFDWSPLARAVVAALAAIPLLGMGVCLGLLFKALRERG